jgi:hypothetical protein
MNDDIPSEEELAPQFLQAAKEVGNLTPGMGLGTKAWDPMKGIQAFARERADAKRRAQIALNRLGIPETPTVERMTMTPMQAIMHARGR